ncbi:Pc13g12690 [Penicillium rubens Wisconsin 54-1255]|uniref:Pc13g12690 protein n=1 Tax=Penicillium rubens (strain ATCC 28089 / DSM 1075 / NRRL 1951 / Wisconsin 54-1255) TaxID=500485 RepID=B6H334_PENRW|nr:Pc13g12690 [Penicillium rubens Wisconsin 54-1255]
MTGADETLAAATAVLQSLARDEPTRGSVSLAFDFEFPATNGARTEYHMHGSSASGVTLKYFLAGYGSDI